MQLFGLVCVSAYLVAALIVGVRLVCLARRTRELPELMIGTSFLSGAMIGHPATLASELLASESSGLVRPLAAASGVTLQCAYILAIPYLNVIFDAEEVAPAFYGTLGLVVALCITHAFYPSQAYLRRIRERAGLEVS